MKLKTLLSKHLPPSVYRRLVSRAKASQAWWHKDDLTRLARIFNTDKSGSHWYTQHYQRYFHELRRRRLNILEIGVGGYEHGDVGGESLRMWKAYFPKSRILGIDICDKTRFRESRIDIRQCDQTDTDALTKLSKEYGGFDIIIDDGSHLNEHVIKTFHALFPLLRPEGFYAIEDIQTAYWPTWGGGIGNPQNSIEQLKSLIDGLNHVEYPLVAYKPTYFDQHVVEIAFFHNLVMIRKGKNLEETNAPGLIEREIRAQAASAP